MPPAAVFLGEPPAAQAEDDGDEPEDEATSGAVSPGLDPSPDEDVEAAPAGVTVVLAPPPPSLPPVTPPLGVDGRPVTPSVSTVATALPAAHLVAVATSDGRNAVPAPATDPQSLPPPEPTVPRTRPTTPPGQPPEALAGSPLESSAFPSPHEIGPISAVFPIDPEALGESLDQFLENCGDVGRGIVRSWTDAGPLADSIALMAAILALELSRRFLRDAASSESRRGSGPVGLPEIWPLR